MIIKKLLNNKNILFIILIGGLLRLYAIGDASLWGDEILSLNAADRINSIKSFLSADSENAHPPLYFLILKFWKYFGNSETYLRILSSFFGLITVYISYLVAIKVFSKKTAYISSILITISPFLIRFDREVRMYSLFVLLTMLTIYFFLQSLDSNRKKNWLLFSFFGILNLYTHYHSIIVLFCCFIFFLISKKYNNYKLLIGSYLIMAFFYSLWLPSFADHFFAYSAIGGNEPSRFPSIYGFWIKPAYLIYSYTFGQSILPWQWGITIPSVLLVTYLLIISSIKIINKKKQIYFLVSFFLLPIILGLILSDLMPRYMIFIYPFYIFLLSNGFDYIGGSLKKLAFIIILLICLISINNYYNEKNLHILSGITPWKKIAYDIKSRSLENDIILNVGNSPSLDYYIANDIIIYGNNLLNRVNEKKIISEHNYWIVIANPAYKSLADDLINIFENNNQYSLVFTNKYKRDNNYKMKREFFNKEFSEYRADIYYYNFKNKD